jgi:hypothetical protein
VWTTRFDAISNSSRDGYFRPIASPPASESRPLNVLTGSIIRSIKFDTSLASSVWRHHAPCCTRELNGLSGVTAVDL